VAAVTGLLATAWFAIGPAGSWSAETGQPPPTSAVAPVADARATSSVVRQASDTVFPRATLPGSPVVFGDQRPTPYLRHARENQMGVRSGIIASFARWQADEPFPAAQARAVRNGGAVPMIAWTSSGITLEQIASGQYDDYVTQWANGAAAYGKPVLLRLFPEMNCKWAWWAPGAHGNTAAQFVDAWHRVVGIFRQVGATNVRWIWNVGYSCDTDLLPMWPGVAWVDYTGVDVYNWGEPTAARADAYTLPMVNLVRQLAPRLPVMLPEIGTSHVFGSPGPWLDEIFRLSAREHIRAVVYFDENRLPEHPDWRLGSDDPFMPRLTALFVGVRAAVHQPRLVTAGRYEVADIEDYLTAEPPPNGFGSGW
jgi:hypothetical protein